MRPYSFRDKEWLHEYLAATKVEELQRLWDIAWDAEQQLGSHGGGHKIMEILLHIGFQPKGGGQA